MPPSAGLRRCNEFSAELVHARPDRFGGFGCLPLPDVDASLEELSFALNVLRLDGIVLFTNSNGVYLGDPILEPMFEELERRKTVVFVHPNPSPDLVAHSLGLPDNLLDFPTDTNRAVAQMHYTNTFARTPNVKYIFSHAGELIPYLAARFAIVDEMGFIAGGEQRGAAADGSSRESFLVGYTSTQRGRCSRGGCFAIGCRTHESQVRRNRWPRSVQRHHGASRGSGGCDLRSAGTVRLQWLRRLPPDSRTAATLINS